MSTTERLPDIAREGLHPATRPRLDKAAHWGGVPSHLSITRVDYACARVRAGDIRDFSSPRHAQRNPRHRRRRGGGRWFGGFDRNLRAPMLSSFVSQKLCMLASKEQGEDLFVLKDLIEAGKITPVIDATYSLSEVPEAIRHLQEGHARGKVVITV
jgi:hypothetical protein